MAKLDVALRNQATTSHAMKRYQRLENKALSAMTSGVFNAWGKI